MKLSRTNKIAKSVHCVHFAPSIRATTNIPTQTLNYTYNADGMLYSETATTSGPGQGSTLEQWAIYYGYDADGDRLETDGGDFLNGQGDEDEASFWEYNANNELHQYQQYNPDQDNPSVTTTTYTYDANGNEIEADSTTEHQQQEDGDGNDSFQFYTYDVRGEMVKYVDGNGTTTTYTYDDAGNRVKEVTPVNGHNTTTTYLTDGNNPTGYAQTIEEHVNGAATPSVTYFVGLTGTQGQTNGSTVIYMLRDNRGYARIFTNAAGTVAQYDQFDAYGNQTTPNNIPSTHYFPDGTLDVASGLTFHFGGRQSSTVNGDFIEQDAYGYGNNQDPLTLNRYNYSCANPVMENDPTGHDADYASTLTVAGEEADEIAEVAPVAKVATAGRALASASTTLYTSLATFLARGITYVSALYESAVVLQMTYDAEKSYIQQAVDDAIWNDVIQHSIMHQPMTKQDLKALDTITEEYLGRHIYLTYSFVQHAASFAGGMWANDTFVIPGEKAELTSFGTTDTYATGWDVHWHLALPSADIQDAEYIILPKEGFEPIGPSVVLPKVDNAKRFLPGGGSESIFWKGSGGPGTVFGPIPIPIGLPPVQGSA